MIKKILIAILNITILLNLAIAANAANISGYGFKKSSGIDKVGQVTGQWQPSGNNDSETLYAKIAKIINWGLGLLGIAFLFLMVYAGFLWMNAKGDDKQISTAKGIIVDAIIGIIIIFGAYAVTAFVSDIMIRSNLT